MTTKWRIPRLRESWTWRNEQGGMIRFFLVLAVRPFLIVITGIIYFAALLLHIWVHTPWSRWGRLRRSQKRREKTREKALAENILKHASAPPILVDKIEPREPNLAKTDFFFGRLPPELRRCILLHAFGQRTLHMDLGFQPAPKLTDKQPTDDRTENCHAGIEFWSLINCSNEPDRWRWRGCVCHRSRPEREPLSLGRLRSHPFALPSHGHPDGCLAGKGHCPHWPGEWPSKCQIGIMGWLLSCRRAYKEGIEVLYGANIIYLSCDILLRGFPEVVSATVLSQVTSLELVWDPQYLPIAKVFEGLDPNQRPINVFPLLPSLAYLHLCLTNLEFEIIGMSQSDGMQTRSMEDLATGMILSLDSTIIRMAPATTAVTVSCPLHEWFEKVKLDYTKTQGNDGIRERESKFKGPEFWRQMPTVKNSTERPLTPSVVERGNEDPGPSRGYWIHFGPAERYIIGRPGIV